MPKKNNNKKGDTPEDENNDKKGKSKFRETKDKAKKSRRKTVKVYLPAIIKKGEKIDSEFADHTQLEDEEPQMTEHQISYQDALLIVEIEKLARQGLNDKQIIAEVGISATTFYERIANEPYFAFALFRHRGVATGKVTNALYNNAIGFNYTEQQATAMGEVVTVQKYKLPETKAQLEYLYNRDKDHWRKKVEPTQEKGKSISHIGVIIKRRE